MNRRQLEAKLNESFAVRVQGDFNAIAAEFERGSVREKKKKESFFAKRWVRAVCAACAVFAIALSAPLLLNREDSTYFFNEGTVGMQRGVSTAAAYLSATELSSVEEANAILGKDILKEELSEKFTLTHIVHYVALDGTQSYVAAVLSANDGKNGYFSFKVSASETFLYALEVSSNAVSETVNGMSATLFKLGQKSFSAYFLKEGCAVELIGESVEKEDFIRVLSKLIE